MGIQTTMLMNGMMTLLNTSKDAGLLKVLQSTEVWREFQKYRRFMFFFSTRY